PRDLDLTAEALHTDRVALQLDVQDFDRDERVGGRIHRPVHLGGDAFADEFAKLVTVDPHPFHYRGQTPPRQTRPQAFAFRASDRSADLHRLSVLISIRASICVAFETSPLSSLRRGEGNRKAA